MLNLEDNGSRWTHYSQLLDLWQDALALLQAQGIHSEMAKDKSALLTAGIEVLQLQLDATSEYNSRSFKFMREIDAAHEAGAELLKEGTND